MYDWLSFLRLRLNDVHADSFILWRANVYSKSSWSQLTLYSCFTAENPKPNFAFIYNVLRPLPSQNQRRLEVPRAALIYLLSHTLGEYIAEPFNHIS